MNDSVFKLSVDWVLHKEDLKETKFFLFNVKDGTIVKLNEISFDFLSRINGEKNYSLILTELLKIYDVNEEQLNIDLTALLKKISKFEILI